MLHTRANDHFGSRNGTSNYYEHLFGIKYTDGVKELAEACKSYWLIDIIVSYQCEEEVKQEQFQVWDLLRIKNSSFDIMATDGNNHFIASQQISFSDFPYDSCSLWLVDGLILLPCEY